MFAIMVPARAALHNRMQRTRNHEVGIFPGLRPAAICSIQTGRGQRWSRQTDRRPRRAQPSRDCSHSSPRGVIFANFRREGEVRTGSFQKRAARFPAFTVTD